MTERVEALISRVIAKHPDGDTDFEQLRYFEDVHQELAPLARELERQRDELLAALESLVDMDVAYQRGPAVEDAVEKAKAAIASMKGGAA